MEVLSDREGIRTPDRLLRRQMLYPAELRGPVDVSAKIRNRRGIAQSVQHLQFLHRGALAVLHPYQVGTLRYIGKSKGGCCLPINSVHLLDNLAHKVGNHDAFGPVW